MSAGLLRRSLLIVARRRVGDGTRRNAGWLRAAVCVLVAMLLLNGCGAIKAPGADVGTQLDDAVPKAILSLPLEDSTGQLRHLSDYAGEALVISDSMTLCQETCPLDTATVVQTARQLDTDGFGGKVQFLTITVDPVRDTVPQIAAYRRLYVGPGALANWSVLTGSAPDIARLWRYLGVYVKKVPQDTPPPDNWRTGEPLTYDIEHSDEVFFLDGKGAERFVLEGAPAVQNRSEVPKVIYHFLGKEGRRNLAHPDPTEWTEGQALHVLSWLLDKHVSSS